eukprot:3123232-Rhodomonas_salina.3
MASISGRSGCTVTTTAHTPKGNQPQTLRADLRSAEGEILEMNQGAVQVQSVEIVQTNREN